MLNNLKPGCPTTSPGRSTKWSSRDIAQALLGHDADLTKFTPYKASYRVSTVVTEQSPEKLSQPSDDMSMDIDEEEVYLDTLLPKHALDLLHLQVVDHFTRLLLELVVHIGGSDIQKKRGESGLSSYAPGYARKDFNQWDAQDCLEYLDKQKPMKWNGVPTPAVFLRRPYSGQGSRRGQDW